MIRFEKFSDDGYHQVVQGTGWNEKKILAIQKDDRGDFEVSTFDPPESFTLTAREVRQLAAFMEQLEGSGDA